MDTPANVGVGAEQLVVRTHQIYSFALALMFIALVASAILFDRSLKALAGAVPAGVMRVTARLAD